MEDVFRWILYEANQAGYIKPETVYIDGTHIKANANINKKIKNRCLWRQPATVRN